VRTIFITLGEDNRVEQWSSARSKEDEIELELDDSHEVFYSSHRLFIFSEGELIKDSDFILLDAKKRKDEEFNKACNIAILAGFEHTIDGVEYHFSYDIEAQINFGDSRALLVEGVVQSVDWTVQSNGEYTRISVTKEIMDELTLAIFTHKQKQIGKYRGELMPLVNSATTLEEVLSINWNSI
jgi:hypothetical protein